MVLTCSKISSLKWASFHNLFCTWQRWVIYVPQAHVLGGQWLFTSKFCISLTNSVSASTKDYWNEFVLGNEEVILIWIPFMIWRTSASEVSADHSLWDCGTCPEQYYFLLKMLVNFINIIYHEIRVRKGTIYCFDLWNGLLSCWFLFWAYVGSYL